ncbi:MAG TPA: UDP-2,3-diacylglucosamine diphosphatase [Gemmatimonadales bacterium]|nr:UDP-2,3-diacylglucosamine diphosphatase [Gemmatimonadales bacterium]
MSPPASTLRVIIVADAHLGQVPAAVGSAFHAFLDEIPRPGDHLVLMGDLFDFWFEYQSVIPRKHFATVTKLQDVRSRGIPITFVGGNHDRWGGSFFTRDLGIAFYGGEAELDLGGRRAFLAHGDGLTEQHWSGKVMHRFTRHPLTVAVFRVLHPTIGFWIADLFSRHLADNTKDRAVLDRAAAAQRVWAADFLARRPDVELVIMAHTHRPVVDRQPDGRSYVNPGAFLDGGRYAVINKEGVVELQQFTAGRLQPA